MCGKNEERLVRKAETPSESRERRHERRRRSSIVGKGHFLKEYPISVSNHFRRWKFCMFNQTRSAHQYFGQEHVQNCRNSEAKMLSTNPEITQKLATMQDQTRRFKGHPAGQRKLTSGFPFCFSSDISFNTILRTIPLLSVGVGEVKRRVVWCSNLP